MQSGLQISPLSLEHLDRLVSFCDEQIGHGYYNSPKLERVYELSKVKDEVCSYIVEDNGHIVAARLSLAPGFWDKDFVNGLSPQSWNYNPNTIAYFQSLFVHPDYRGRGLGTQLSKLSIQTLQKQGTQAVVCHSWLESPNNSSQKYLIKMGFRPVKRHLRYWEPIDYDCVRCTPQRCQCTAEEMILKLEEESV